MLLDLRSLYEGSAGGVIPPGPGGSGAGGGPAATIVKIQRPQLPFPYVVDDPEELLILGLALGLSPVEIVLLAGQ